MTELDGLVGGRAAAAALPQVLGGHPAAVLLVDLSRRAVLYANDLARQLAAVDLPVDVGEWSRAAGLRAGDGEDLEDGPNPLERVAAGEPVRGELVTAARGSDTSEAREDLWVVGIPLQDAPAPLVGHALVVVLPLRDADAVRHLQSAGDLRHRAVVASDLSFTISDPHAEDDPLVWVNPAFELATGYTAEEVLGRNCRFLQGPDTDRAAVARIGDGIRGGGMVSEILLNHRKDGTPFWNQLVISPVHDSTGRLTHHVGIQTDVTERVRAEQRRERALGAERSANRRLRFLASVGESLARLLDPDGVLSSLPDLVVPELADWALAIGLDERGGPASVHLAHRDPEVGRAGAALLAGDHPAWTRRSPVVSRVLTGGVPSLHANPVTTERLRSLFEPDVAAAFERLGLGAAVTVPLTARGGVVGALVLVRADAAAFGEEDRASVADLGLRAGLALDNARLYEREHSAALTLQRSLLPELPHLEHFDVAATYRPASARAEVGGDWYDVLDLPGSGVGIAIGDVTGHDLQAAAAMGQLRSVLRSYAWQGSTPAQVVTNLDTLVQGLGMADVATCTYAVVEDGRGPGRITWSSAGHPPPLLRTPDGRVRFLEGALTTPIGVVAPDEPVTQASTEMPPGSVLVLYTDGLVERRGEDLGAGLERLRGALAATPDDAGAAAVCDELVERLVPSGGAQEDDTCVLVVRRRP